MGSSFHCQNCSWDHLTICVQHFVRFFSRHGPSPKLEANLQNIKKVLLSYHGTFFSPVFTQMWSSSLIQVWETSKDLSALGVRKVMSFYTYRGDFGLAKELGDDIASLSHLWNGAAIWSPTGMLIWFPSQLWPGRQGRWWHYFFNAKSAHRIEGYGW